MSTGPSTGSRDAYPGRQDEGITDTRMILLSGAPIPVCRRLRREQALKLPVCASCGVRVLCIFKTGAASSRIE